jgi:hypothetical protein
MKKAKITTKLSASIEAFRVDKTMPESNELR